MHHPRPLAFATVVMLVCCLRVATPVRATGDSAAVHGTVTDTSGLPIAAARVTFIRDHRDHQEAEARTDEHGSFKLTGLAAGSYVLQASADGFAPLTPRSLALPAGADVALDLALARADLSSIVKLGTVSINGRESLSTSSSPTVNLNAADLAARGVQQIVSELGQQIGVTITQPNGAAPGAPALVSLRGPDPSETLIEIDGHAVNNSNTGDFDLELIDPSEFSNVQVVYGIGPSSLVGANTQGGAVNFRTIEPTPHDAGLLRLSFGSFGTSAETLQATGTSDKLGYAFSWHRYDTDGAVHDFVVTDDQSLQRAVIGSTITATTTLAKLRYSFGSGDGFAELIVHDTAGYRDLSAPLSVPDNQNQTSSGATFQSFAGSAAFTHQPSYGLDLQLPLGPNSAQQPATATLLFRHLTSVSAQTIEGAPAGNSAVGLSPWLITNDDRVDEDSVLYDRQLPYGDLTFGADLRSESLHAPSAFAPDRTSEGQTQRSYLARYEWAELTHLRFTFGAYLSDFTTFGTSVDPRLAVVWTPTQDTVARASLGTAFRAPLLTERFVPSVLPPQDTDGFINIGNPNLTAERTTEYELGYEHRFAGSHGLRAGLSSYQTNLRDPIFTLIPQPIPCVIRPTNPCLSFPINVANVVYRGVESTLDQPLRGSTNVQLEYGINSAFPVSVPQPISDPTAPTFVAGQQFQGIALHSALLKIDHRPAKGLSWMADAAYQGVNNQLNRPPHLVYNASVGYRLRHTAFALTGTNLGNIYDSRFTWPGAGVPYPGAKGPVRTDAFALPPHFLTLTATYYL